MQSQFVAIEKKNFSRLSAIGLANRETKRNEKKKASGTKMHKMQASMCSARSIDFQRDFLADDSAPAPANKIMARSCMSSKGSKVSQIASSPLIFHSHFFELLAKHELDDGDGKRRNRQNSEKHSK
jgi:hypothetical protein